MASLLAELADDSDSDASSEAPTRSRRRRATAADDSASASDRSDEEAEAQEAQEAQEEDDDDDDDGGGDTDDADEEDDEEEEDGDSISVEAEPAPPRKPKNPATVPRGGVFYLHGEATAATARRAGATGGEPPRLLKSLIFIAWTAVANAQRLGAPWARRVALAAPSRVAAGVDCSSWDGDHVGCSGCVASGECVYNERTSLCETVADTEKCPAGDFGPTGGEECDYEDLKCEMFSDECLGCADECSDGGFERCDDVLAICGIGKDLGEHYDAAIKKIEEEAEELGGDAKHPCAARPCLEGKFKKCAMAVEAWCAPVATGGVFPNGDPEVAPATTCTAEGCSAFMKNLRANAVDDVDYGGECPYAGGVCDDAACSGDVALGAVTVSEDCGERSVVEQDMAEYLRRFAEGEAPGTSTARPSARRVVVGGALTDDADDACAPPATCDCEGQGYTGCPCEAEGCAAVDAAPLCDRALCAPFKAEVVHAVEAAGGVQPVDEHWLRGAVAPGTFAAHGEPWTMPDFDALAASDAGTACGALARSVYDCVETTAAFCNEIDWEDEACGRASTCGDGLLTWGEDCDDGAHRGPGRLRGLPEGPAEGVRRRRRGLRDLARLDGVDLAETYALADVGIYEGSGGGKRALADPRSPTARVFTSEGRFSQSDCAADEDYDFDGDGVALATLTPCVDPFQEAARAAASYLKWKATHEADKDPRFASFADLDVDGLPACAAADVRGSAYVGVRVLGAADYAARAFAVEALGASSAIHDARALATRVLRTTTETVYLYDQEDYCEHAEFVLGERNEAWEEDPCCNPIRRYEQCCERKDVEAGKRVVVEGVDEDVARDECTASVVDRVAHIQRSLAESATCREKLDVSDDFDRDYDQFWKFKDECLAKVARDTLTPCTDTRVCPCAYSKCVQMEDDFAGCVTASDDYVKCEAECLRGAMDPLAKRFLYEDWGIDPGFGADAEFDGKFSHKIGEGVCVESGDSGEYFVHDAPPIGFPVSREVCDADCQLEEACTENEYEEALRDKICPKAREPSENAGWGGTIDGEGRKLSAAAPKARRLAAPKARKLPAAAPMARRLEEVVVEWKTEMDESDIFFEQGQTLTFEWVGNHDLWLFPNEEAYNQCDFEGEYDGERAIFLEGEYESEQSIFFAEVSGQQMQEWGFDDEGDRVAYFGCSVGRHCANQDMKVKVTYYSGGEEDGEEDDGGAALCDWANDGTLCADNGDFYEDPNDADKTSCTFGPDATKGRTLACAAFDNDSLRDKTCCQANGATWRSTVDGGECCYGEFERRSFVGVEEVVWVCQDEVWMDCEDTGCDRSACDACSAKYDSCCELKEFTVNATACLEEERCNDRWHCGDPAEGNACSADACYVENDPGWCGTCWGTQCFKESRRSTCTINYEDATKEEVEAECAKLGDTAWVDFRNRDTAWDGGALVCHLPVDGDAADPVTDCFARLTESDVAVVEKYCFDDRDARGVEDYPDDAIPAVNWLGTECIIGCYYEQQQSDEDSEERCRHLGNKLNADLHDWGLEDMRVNARGEPLCFLRYATEDQCDDVDKKLQDKNLGGAWYNGGSLWFEPGRLKTQAECDEGWCTGIPLKLEGQIIKDFVEGGYTRAQCEGFADGTQDDASRFYSCSTTCYSCVAKAACGAATREHEGVTSACAWERSTFCEDEASCLAAGECVGGYEHERVGVRNECKDKDWTHGDLCYYYDEQTRRTAECGDCEWDVPGVCVDASKARDECASYDHEHPYGCRMVDGAIHTREACADAGGEWFLPATTKAECLAFLGCEETFGHEVTSKSEAECDKCGGVYGPRYAWADGLWTPPVVRDLTWFPRTEMTPARLVQKRATERRLDEQLRGPMMRAFVQRRVVEKFLKYSMWLDVVLDLLCRCGSAGADVCETRAAGGGVAATATGFCDELRPLSLGCADAVLEKSCGGGGGGGRRLASGGAVDLTFAPFSAGDFPGLLGDGMTVDAGGAAFDALKYGLPRTGDDCSVVDCPVVGGKPCSGNGSCRSNGACECDGEHKHGDLDACELPMFARRAVAQRRGGYESFPAPNPETAYDGLGGDGFRFPSPSSAPATTSTTTTTRPPRPPHDHDDHAAASYARPHDHDDHDAASYARPHDHDHDARDDDDRAAQGVRGPVHREVVRQGRGLQVEGRPGQTQPVGDSGEFGQGDGDFTEGGAGTCADNTKKDSCKDAGCTWDGKSSPKCQPGGSGGEGEDEAEAVKAPKCKKLKTKDECKANKKTCEWTKDKCKDKPSGGEGEDEAEAEAEAVKAPKCKKLKTKDECKANKKTCEWTKDKCKDKPSGSGGEGEDEAEAEAVKAPKCKKLKTKDECKANKKTCEWTKDKCKDKPSGSGGEGEDEAEAEAEAVKAPKCKKLKTKDECKANKKTCEWTKDKCKDK
ncbi:hypothetical protein JL721_2303 [Aureococcus anophagefferens]|nr:hypothetical protein JL721_2303 [Aureococcus anophagefferens]